MNGRIRIKPNKNLKKPAVKTLISCKENFISTFIVTPDTEATKARIIALTLLLIIYKNGISQISPVYFFVSIIISNLSLDKKYGLFIIAMPITLLNVGEYTADLISPITNY
tara:strand:- start:169 stop:501 length:333 start_codon:yes stop_codon:yes gene_type:complete